MSHPQQYILSRKLIDKCPVCSTSTADDLVEIVAEDEHGFLSYLRCSVCHTGLLARVSQVPHGLMGTAMITDLELPEVRRFGEGDAVGSDEVLAVRELLGQPGGLWNALQKET